MINEHAFVDALVPKTLCLRILVFLVSLLTVSMLNSVLRWFVRSCLCRIFFRVISAFIFHFILDSI